MRCTCAVVCVGIYHLLAMSLVRTPVPVPVRTDRYRVVPHCTYSCTYDTSVRSPGDQASNRSGFAAAGYVSGHISPCFSILRALSFQHGPVEDGALAKLFGAIDFVQELQRSKLDLAIHVVL